MHVLQRKKGIGRPTNGKVTEIWRRGPSIKECCGDPRCMQGKREWLAGTLHVRLGVRQRAELNHYKAIRNLVLQKNPRVECGRGRNLQTLSKLP